MKNFHAVILSVTLAVCFNPLVGQNVAINTDGSLPDTNAILDIKARNKGILVPRMDSGARASIPATKGLLVFDTTYGTYWYHNGSSWQNLSPEPGWGLQGNSGTAISTNYIGTRDNVPFIIRVNSELSGRLPVSDSMCTSYGYMAGYSNGPGAVYNTAIGKYALLANSSGSGNTAVGHSALKGNESGYYNTANGGQSLYYNRHGNQNTACGYFSQFLDTSGTNNTAIGFAALWTNTVSDNNTAIGAYADVANAVITNSTAIGYRAVVNASNKIRLGNSSVTIIEGQVPFTTPSDGRFKSQVQEDVKGLDFITRLRPVTYLFDVKRFDAQQAGTTGNTDVQWAGYNEAALLRRSGFIAQEVEKAAEASGYNFSGISKPQNAQDHYGLSYETFVVPLVKAMQELNAQVVELQRQVEVLKQAAASK